MSQAIVIQRVEDVERDQEAHQAATAERIEALSEMVSTEPGRDKTRAVREDVRAAREDVDAAYFAQRLETQAMLAAVAVMTGYSECRDAKEAVDVIRR